MSRKMFIFSSIAILAIGFIIGIYLYKDMAKRPSVSGSEVKSESAADVLNLSGKVKSATSADLGFEIGGTITELDHAVGDQVKKGAVLAKVDSSDLNSQYQAAQDQINAAQSTLEKYQQLVKVDKYKSKSLKKSSSANYNDKKAQEAQVSADEAAAESQQAQISALENTAQSLKVTLDKTIITAPFDGLITKQDVKVGEIAVSNTVNPVPIITMIDDNNFEIDAYASELDVKNISVGQDAKVTLDNDGQQVLDAKVIAIDPAATLQNNVSSYKVTLNFTESNLKLSSGTDANVEIDLGN